MNEKIKILYIDDDFVNVELFKINFSKKYNVFSGISGTEGLEILKNNTDIQFVFSDLRMPEMDGLEFIKKAYKLYPEIRYFILTAYDTNKELQQAIDERIIVNCISKPFEREDIDINISKILESES